MMKRYLLAIAAMVLLAPVIFSADPAFAQTVDMRSPAMEVVTWLIGLLATILSAVGAVGFRLVLAKFGLTNSQLEQNLNDRLNDIIFKGMDYALATAKNEVLKKGSGLEAVKFDNYFMSLAASYVAERAPQILKRFSVTQQKLEEMIWARIPAYVQTVPITGGAATSETAKQVAAVTGGPEAATSTPPVVVQPKAETPLPAVKASGIFGANEAPDTGA